MPSHLPDMSRTFKKYKNIYEYRQKMSPTELHKEDVVILHANTSI